MPPPSGASRDWTVGNSARIITLALRRARKAPSPHVSLSLPLAARAAAAHTAEVVSVDEVANPEPQAGAGLLVEAEVNPAVDASVVDVPGYLLECGVVEGHSRYGSVRQAKGV